jgi:hypothetical protein
MGISFTNVEGIMHVLARHIFDKAINIDEMSKTLSNVFRVNEQDILVTETYPLAENILQSPRILCWLSFIGGDFPCRADIYLEKILLPKVEYQTQAVICEILNCRALVASDEINPYSWILIYKKDQYQKVYVDYDKLDENQQFTIVRYADYL